jgi:hypothetical protein
VADFAAVAPHFPQYFDSGFRGFPHEEQVSVTVDDPFLCFDGDGAAVPHDGQNFKSGIIAWLHFAQNTS